MEVQSWITADLESMRNRLNNGVLAIIPAECMAERVDGGEIAPVCVVWHAAHHQDLAVKGVPRGADQVLTSWASRVGATDDTWRRLADGLDLVPQLQPQAVGDLGVLDETPDSAAALERDRHSSQPT